MTRASKIKDIHVLWRNGRWTAVWQNQQRTRRVVRHTRSPEHALISLLASELLEPNSRAAILGHAEFIVWLEAKGLMNLRRHLLFAKGSGWDLVSRQQGIVAYRKWRKEQTSGTFLALGE